MIEITTAHISAMMLICFIHYVVVMYLVSEAIKEYNLDRYTPYAVWSLTLWFPIIYVIHRYA